MKNLILTPNPYRDKNFHTVRSAMQSLPPDASSPQIAALLPDTIPLNDIVCIRFLLR